MVKIAQGLNTTSPYQKAPKVLVDLKCEFLFKERKKKLYPFVFSFVPQPLCFQRSNLGKVCITMNPTDVVLLIFTFLLALLNGITNIRAQQIRDVTISLDGDIFPWGTILPPLIFNIIKAWDFLPVGLAGHPQANQLGKFSDILSELPNHPAWRRCLQCGENILIDLGDIQSIC